MKQRNTPSEPIEPSIRKAVVYARVSSKEQEKEGYSIPAQLKLLKDYAVQEGLCGRSGICRRGNGQNHWLSQFR